MKPKKLNIQQAHHRQNQQQTLTLLSNQQQASSVANKCSVTNARTQADRIDLSNGINSKKKKAKHLSKDVSLAIVRFNEEDFDNQPKLQLSFENSLQNLQLEALVLNFSVKGRLFTTKVYQIRIEVAFEKPGFRMVLDKHRRVIKLWFQLGVIFLKEETCEKWDKQQSLQKGQVVMKFQLKDTEILNKFLKKYLNEVNYTITENFKPLQDKHNTQAMVFNQNLNKECLKHKQQILFDIMKIKKATTNQTMKCPVQACGKVFSTPLLTHQHMQSSHSWLKKYGIHLKNIGQTWQFQFSEQILNYVLTLSRYYPEEIKQITKKLQH